MNKEEVRTKLAEYGIDDKVAEKIIADLGVENLDDLASLEAMDLVNAGVKLAKARKLMNDLKTANAGFAAASPEANASRAQLEELLPEVPTDGAWLAALKTGGILKVDNSSYIAAIRAALADRVGMYRIPTTLSEAMERFADESEEQVDPVFFALRKALTRRTYGDVFAAIDGLDGTYITETRRRTFLKRVRSALWPALIESYRALDAWYQTWRSSFADPSVLIAALGGGFNGATSASIIAPPDIGPLHDAGDNLIDAINRAFRGTGVQVAAALAYEASTIRTTLEDPRLPSMVGAPNRELMLKKIGANVPNNYVRLEQNLVRYTLSFVGHDAVASDVEARYFTALWQLGAQINWDELCKGSSTKNSWDQYDGSSNDELTDVITGKPI